MAALASSAAVSIQKIPAGLVSNGQLRLPARTARVVISSRLVAAQEKVASVQKALVNSGNKFQQALTVLATNAMMVLPALANEEKGELFDFNLTLPIIAVEILLLMVALDNVWFKPVSAVMDGRDDEIRKKLSGVRDNSAEITQLQMEAEAVLKAARAETALQAAKMKKELAAELDAKLQATRARIEKELEASLANLDKQKVETMKSLDSQVQVLSDDIVSKLIPFKA